MTAPLYPAWHAYLPEAARELVQAGAGWAVTDASVTAAQLGPVQRSLPASVRAP